MTEILWTGQEIAAAVNGKLTEDFKAYGVRIDSRNVQSGDVFFAVPGKTFNDGHQYVDSALANGAAGVVIQKGKATPAVIVEDSFKALEDLGQAAVNRCQGMRIAITGSVGKTTCRAMADRVLSAFGKTHASADSLNNKWGVPLSLARMPKDAAYGIFEVGMNDRNEIVPLSKQISPYISIITTVEAVHLEKLGTLENVALAKAEIFQGMAPDGIVVLPRDSEKFPLLLAEARTNGIKNILTFGSSEGSSVKIVSVAENEKSSLVNLEVDGKIYKFQLGIAGRHHVFNAAAIICMVLGLGLDVQTALDALKDMQSVSGRGNNEEIMLMAGKAPLLLIDETHNASPVAVKAALNVLKNTMVKNKRIVVLGDMLELGTDSKKFHAELAPFILAVMPDLILLSGPIMENLAKVLPENITRHYADSAALSTEIISLVAPGDTVLVKGSRGSKMKLVIDALRGLGQVETTSETRAQAG